MGASGSEDEVNGDGKRRRIRPGRGTAGTTAERRRFPDRRNVTAVSATTARLTRGN